METVVQTFLNKKDGVALANIKRNVPLGDIKAVFVEYSENCGNINDIIDYLGSICPIVFGSTTDGHFSHQKPIISVYGLTLKYFLGDVEFKTCSINYQNIDQAKLDFGPNFKPKHIMVISESLGVADGEKVSQIIRDSFPEATFSGFMSADQWKFVKTYQILNKLKTGEIIYIGLDGNFKVETRESNAFFPISYEYNVCRIEGNHIKSINGKSPVEYLRKTLGNDQLKRFSQFPIEFMTMEKRAIREVHEDGTIVLFSSPHESINENEDILLRLCKATKESIIESIYDLAPDKVPISSIISFCSAQRITLNDELQNYISKLTDIIDTPFVGGGVYGEFNNGTCNMSTIATHFYRG